MRIQMYWQGVHICLVLFFILPSTLSAQYTVEAQILESHSGIPVAYANIGVLNKAVGTVSDDNGQFALSALHSDDTVVISCIGYSPIALAADSIRANNTVTMVPTEYAIPAVEIRASDLSTDLIMLGVKNRKRGLSIAYGSPQLGAEIGAALHVKQPTLIRSAHFVLNHAKGDSLLFRLNLYAFENGIVGAPLLKDNIYILEKQRKGTFSIDLTGHNIILEENVLVTLEWLRDFDEVGNKNITFDTKKDKRLNGIYTRFYSHGPLELFEYNRAVKPCIYLMGRLIEN